MMILKTTCTTPRRHLPLFLSEVRHYGTFMQDSHRASLGTGQAGFNAEICFLPTEASGAKVPRWDLEFPFVEI